MAHIDEGTVLGGRYEITGRVMASAQQDQVLTGLDKVLNREVLILVASRDNASQAAQSARQLATGERTSSIQILDLGLSDNRTYLVAPGNADVEDFLALLTTGDVYVEPFFTEHLGTELFGEARQATPQTFDDDAEYYRELQEELAEEDDDSKRPEFINKLSDRIDNWLHEDTDDLPVTPGQTPAKGTAGAAGAAGASAGAAAARNRNANSRTDTQQDDQRTEVFNAPEDDDRRTEVFQAPADEQRTEVFNPVTEQQDQAPAPVPPPPITTEPAREKPRKQAPPVIPPAAPEERAADDGYAIEYTDEKPRSTVGRWIAGVALVAILVAAVVIGFRVLGSPEEEPPVANEPTAEAPADNEGDAPAEDEAEQEPTGPEPVPASVERIVPDAPGLTNEYDADLPAIVDGNQATAWHTLTFTTPQFGGFASNLALVVELEEKAPVSEITIAQNQGSGGAFTVSVANEPDPDAGVVITEGSFTGPEYTVDAHNSDGEPIEARYVIINFTELPTLSNTNSPDRPFGLRIAEIDVN
ncbi:discoidin domain-containing protein [Enteractinococcus helveticum]|uniref:Uncharacterized protein n=1 Tax=Enteractinococcus helveticum TaxID=1837282 RepID=A0A1B7LVK4_9MICC|nr:discoidin domain-containing protein [Enteractinococcus helveticum]OAV53842.1 hypothetical protein A6F49_00630 [Enteractinococcus helveticum]